MLRILLVLFFTSISTLSAFSQGEPMFVKHVLDNPVEYSQWIDSSLELIYVDVYEKQNTTQTTCLENGYVQYQFSSGSNLRDSHWGAIPTSIDVVYTKYPFSREDWQTNYFTLLANRLKELFLLDSTLNSNSIKWRLIMQTNCKTGGEAKEFFHGIVINYTPQVLVALPAITPHIPVKMPQVVAKFICAFTSYTDTPIVNEDELEATLYPKTIFNRDMKQQIPEREKRYREPGCSKFKTRADKPRTSLWARLFR